MFITGPLNVNDWFTECVQLVTQCVRLVHLMCTTGSLNVYDWFTECVRLVH